MSGNFAIKGGGRGVGPLMANAILNFHFDFLTPSLICGYLGYTKCFGFTRIVGQNLIVWVAWYPMIFKTELDQVVYRKNKG